MQPWIKAQVEMRGSLRRSRRAYTGSPVAKICMQLACWGVQLGCFLDWLPAAVLSAAVQQPTGGGHRSLAAFRDLRERCRGQAIPSVVQRSAILMAMTQTRNGS